MKRVDENLLNHPFFFLKNPGIAEESRAFRALGRCARNKNNLVSWAKMPLNKYLLISLRGMSPTRAQVQNHELLALKQYCELPLDATKEMKVLEGKLM